MSLKPFLAIVSNEPEHKIVAFSVLWKFTDHEGNLSQWFAQFKYPDAVAGISGTGRDAWALENIGDREMIPGEKRVVSVSFAVSHRMAIEEYWQNWLLEAAKSYHDKYGRTEELTISLDTVIFDDGAILGPDEYDLSHHFTAYLNAKQSAFRNIVAALDSGRSIDRAFTVIESVEVPTADSLMADPTAIYGRLAAEEIMGLRRRVGDQVLSTLVRKAVRDKDFVVQRNDRD